MNKPNHTSGVNAEYYLRLISYHSLRVITALTQRGRVYSRPNLWVDFFDVNVAFLQGASTTKIEPCFTHYTLQNHIHLSQISFNTTKRSLFVVLGLLDF